MIDTQTEARQRWIANLPRETAHEIKVAQAIERMGTTYLCHPDNRVKRLAGPVPAFLRKAT